MTSPLLFETHPTSTKKRKTLSNVKVEEDLDWPQVCFVEIPKDFKWCQRCGTVETPKWRYGPDSLLSLCNACHLRWKRIGKQKDGCSSTTFPPPFSNITERKYGKFKKLKMSKKGDNKDHKIMKLPSPPKELTDKEPFFTRIRSNIFVERQPRHRLDEQDVCYCLPPTERDQFGCGEDCINRILFYECDPKWCPCGTKCSNQRFQRKERKGGLQVFQTDHRGWGLRTNVDIKKGDLIIEYCGEIISRQLCEERMCTTYINEKNFYFLYYCNGEVIDAGKKGTEARFINHSCDPNCNIEKWSLKGELHYGVFASKDINAHTEVSSDYNFSTFNGSVKSEQICHCSSSLCRGTIGKRASGIARQK